jgi:hypothetical protein
MEPEISHRCPSCGAAVRARAAFCPQCGRPTQKGEGTEQSLAVEAVEPPQLSAPEGEPLAEAQSAKVADSEPVASSYSETSVVESQDVEDVERARVEVAGGPVVEGGARVKRHRVAEAARDAREAVEERLGPRVEKLRKASNVVLDEAAYDPSLRFVLIAIFIFIVFVVILLISSALR